MKELNMKMNKSISVSMIKLFSCYMVLFMVLGCQQSGNSPVPVPLTVPENRYHTFALRTANYLLGQQDAGGAIPDVPQGESVNMDSNMEYALIGLAAAYRHGSDRRYLTALERGIRWLAAREEMTDPQWRGSWFYAYSSTPPYAPLPTSPDDPAIIDVRGVDATSALFVYLLYLHANLSGSNALAQQYKAHATAALDFVLTNNQSPDGFFYSSWQQWKSDGQWHLWPFRYAADQGDVYLGMFSGGALYNDSRYKNAAQHLKQQTPVTFFDAARGRYAVGINEDGSLESELDGFNGIFPQGYLGWVFGNNQTSQAALGWLTARVQSDGSLVCYPGDPRFSLSAALYAMSSAALGKPFPAKTMDWMLANTYDSSDGGIRDTLDKNSEKYPNVAGFSVAALLEFPAVPATASQ